MRNTIRNIGILAHVDAGKTTLTEHFLFLGGAIREKGSVDKGSAVSDSLSVERERGISVKAATNTIFWEGHQINLIDTPGHQDFFGEVDRVLSVLDGAIFVISAVEGLQSTLFLLWEAVRHYKIPFLIFINKIDRAGSDTSLIKEQISEELHSPVFQMNYPINEGSPDVCLRGFREAEDFLEVYLETLATYDESIMEDYLGGKAISDEQIKSSLCKSAINQSIIPIFCGSVKMEKGPKELLDGIITMLPEARQLEHKQLNAKVFKVEHHKTLGRIAYVRCFSGSIKVRDKVFNQRLQEEEKVAQIYRISGKKSQDLDELNGGDIAMVSGMSNIRSGDWLGKHQTGIPEHRFQEPVLQVRIEAVNKQDTQRLGEALYYLTVEDPYLAFNWDKDEQEMHINLMGSIQQEIIGGILNDRFNIDVHFNPPTVIYKETPQGKAQALVEYTMPKPCWAVMLLKLNRSHRDPVLNIHRR